MKWILDRGLEVVMGDIMLFDLLLVALLNYLEIVLR